MREPTLTDLIEYIGQRPLRAGRVALAVICITTDFTAFAKRGRPITGAVYIKGFGWPSYSPAPRNWLAAVLYGYRWGSVQHRLLTGTLRRCDAVWIAEQWRDGVPI